jgi:septum formation protein
MAPNGVGFRPRLVLASASPRRRQLLESAGVGAEACTANIDETPRTGEHARELVRRLAAEKAEAVVAALAEDRSHHEAARSASDRTVVIGADTVVSVDDEIFGKPTSDAEARCMLSRLSGRPHCVLTGVAVSMGGRTESGVSETTVWFRELDAADIDCYVACGEPDGKAGAYAIQGRGSMFVDRIDGSFHGVVGLPIAMLDRLCCELGWPLTTWTTAQR